MTNDNPTQTTDAATIETPGTNDAKAPTTTPWGDDFNAEKAWSLIQHLRAENSTLKTDRRTTTDNAATAAETAASALADAIARAEKAEAAAHAATRDAALSRSGLPETFHVFVNALDADGIAAQITALKGAIGTLTPEPTPAGPRGPRPVSGLTPGHGGNDAPFLSPDQVAENARAARR